MQQQMRLECVASCAGRHHVCNYPDSQKKQSEGLHCLWIGPCWLVNGLQVQTPFSVRISRHVAVLKSDWKSCWCFKSFRLRVCPACRPRGSVEGCFHSVYERQVWCHLQTEDGQVRPDLRLRPVRSALPLILPPPTLHSTDLLQYS